MVDQATGINVGQALQGELMAFGLESDPGSQSLFDDPPLGAVETCGELVDLCGEFAGDISVTTPVLMANPLKSYPIGSNHIDFSCPENSGDYQISLF